MTFYIRVKMPFPRQIIDQAWQRSDGFCECRDAGHRHGGRCDKLLLRWALGDRYRVFGWEAHSLSGSYRETASDCQVLCRQCYRIITGSTDSH